MRRFVDVIVRVGCTRRYVRADFATAPAFAMSPEGRRIEPGADRVPDTPCDRLLGRAGIDHDVAVRVLGRDREIGLAQLLMKFRILGLEPVRLGFAAAQLYALQSHFNRHVENKREVRRKTRRSKRARGP